MKILESKFSDLEREQLISKIDSMKTFDELHYNHNEAQDFNVIIKLDSGFLFKGIFTENYVFIPYL
jgi:hypothetical protein